MEDDARNGIVPGLRVPLCGAVLVGSEDPPSELMEGDLRRGRGVSRRAVTEALDAVTTCSEKIPSVLRYSIAQPIV